MIKVEVFSYFRGKALVKKLDDPRDIPLRQVNISQLEIPEEYKVLEILYG